MKILTSGQIKEIDKYTIEHEPITSLDLMERAARTLANSLMKRFPTSTPVKIFAGPGNNGGDALVIARIMGERGYQPEVYLFNIKSDLSSNCEANKLRLLENKNIRFSEITTQFDPPRLTADDLIIDGLFGCGLNRPLNGGFASVIKYINASPAFVVSIDVPSGLMCEDNTYNVKDHIIKADITYTFQLPKLAFLLADNAPFLGEVEVLDIHLSDEGIAGMSTPYSIIEQQEVSRLIKPRARFAHKGTYGHALLIAGKQNMAGAAILAARACLRSGVGLLTVDSPCSNREIMQGAVPEAIFFSEPNEHRFTMPIGDTEKYAALAIGPGIGTEKETALAMIEQVKQAHQKPIVLDADALNILESHRGWVTQLPKHTILTPHPKEFERIVGSCENAFERLSKAKELAIRQQLFIILKGAYTAIVNPNGSCRFNPTGNPGMATGGCGDVLTGILLALLAQGYSCQDACELGVYIHGLAGDLAAEDLGEISLTAGDVVNYLPKAWKTLQK